jgi:hypothetical protein
VVVDIVLPAVLGPRKCAVNMASSSSFPSVFSMAPPGELGCLLCALDARTGSGWGSERRSQLFSPHISRPGFLFLAISSLESC